MEALDGGREESMSGGLLAPEREELSTRMRFKRQKLTDEQLPPAPVLPPLTEIQRKLDSLIESIYLPRVVVRDCRALPICSRSRLANRETALNSPRLERPAMQKVIGFLAVIVIGLCLSGCSTVSPYSVKVNGYTDPGAPAPIKPGGFFCVIENKEAKNPLLEEEVKGKITKLLETQGYPVTTFDKADYCLLFAYGMGEPRSAGVAAPDYYGSVGWGMGGGYGWGGWGGWGGPSVSVGIPWGGSADSATLYDRWLLIKVVDGARLPGPPGYSPRMGGGSPERGRLL